MRFVADGRSIPDELLAHDTDKRTYENVRIARKKCPAIASIVRRVETASDFREIEKRLEET
jgi:hypothetical protein